MENIISQISTTTRSLLNAGKNREAIEFLKEISVASLGLMGAALSDSDYESAIYYLNLSLEMNPFDWIMHANKSHCHNINSNFIEAAKSIEKAITYSEGKSSEIFFNAGVIYSSLKNTKKSIEMYEKAIKLSPNSSIYKFNLGCELLRNGNFETGWGFYEYRLKSFPVVEKIKSRSKAPDWDGSKIDRLFVYNEQGIGDFFQFMRYFPLVKEKCKHVIIEVQKEIGDIVKNYPGIDEVIYRGNEFYETPKADAICSISSFPYLFKASPNNVPLVPYIDVEGSIKFNKKTVGIVWAGNAKHAHDFHRSFSLSLFKNISKHVNLISLQKDCKERIWKGNKVSLIENNTFLNEIECNLNNNFVDCAKLIKGVDLVITADTAVAHLAGALNRPVWLIIGYISDFRWGNDIDTSFWYPSMKIFRKGYNENWENVFERIEKEIEKLFK